MLWIETNPKLESIRSWKMKLKHWVGNWTIKNNIGCKSNPNSNFNLKFHAIFIKQNGKCILISALTIDYSYCVRCTDGRLDIDNEHTTKFHFFHLDQLSITQIPRFNSNPNALYQPNDLFTIETMWFNHISMECYFRFYLTESIQLPIVVPFGLSNLNLV